MALDNETKKMLNPNLRGGSYGFSYTPSEAYNDVVSAVGSTKNIDMVLRKQSKQQDQEVFHSSGKLGTPYKEGSGD